MSPHSKYVILLYCALTSIYIYIKFLQIYVNPIVFPDTGSYVSIAKYSLFDLYTAGRPFTYPLFLRLFSTTNYDVVAFQVLFSVISWIFLAFVVSKLYKNYAIKFTIYITILLLSLSVTITQWDTMILSESISFSLFAIFLGLNILLITSKLNKKILFPLIVIVGILFSFTRDSNSYVVLQASIVYLTSYIVLSVFKYVKDINTTKQHLSYVILAFIFLITYYIQGRLIELSHRTLFGLNNIFGIRILTNNKSIEYFVTKWDMPLNKDILQCAGHYASDKHCTYENQSVFRNWVADKGFEAYRSFLTSHLAEVISIYASLIPKSLNYTPKYTQDVLFNSIYFSIPQQIFYANLWDTLFLAFLAILVIIILFFVMRPYFINSYLTRYLIIISLFFVSLGQVFIGYFGDSMEVARHSILASISFKLAFIILVFIILEFVILNYLNLFAYIKTNSIKLIILFAVGIIAASSILILLPESTTRFDGWLDPDDFTLTGDFMSLGHDQILFINLNLENKGDTMIADFIEGQPAKIRYKDNFDKKICLGTCLGANNTRLAVDLAGLGYKQLFIYNAQENKTWLFDFIKKQLIKLKYDRISTKYTPLEGDFLNLKHDQILFITNSYITDERVTITDFNGTNSSGGEGTLFGGWTDPEDVQLAGDFMDSGYDQVLFINRRNAGDGKIMIADFSNDKPPVNIKYWENWGESNLFNGWLDADNTQLVGDFMDLGHDQVLFINRNTTYNGRVMIADFSKGKPPSIKYYSTWNDKELGGWTDPEDVQLAGDFMDSGYDQVLFINRRNAGDGKIMIADFSNDKPPVNIKYWENW